MKILVQIGILFGLCWISQCIESVLPIAFPASVIGLLLLLALLLLRVLKVKHIQEKSDFLMQNLPFFFVPASVGILNYAELLRDNAVAFVVICLVSTVVTFAATAWTVQWIIRRMDGGRQR